MGKKKYLRGGEKGDFAELQNRTSEQFSEVTLLGFGRRDKQSELTVCICKGVKEARQMNSVAADRRLQLHSVCFCLSCVLTSLSPDFCMWEGGYSTFLGSRAQPRPGTDSLEKRLGSL